MTEKRETERDHVHTWACRGGLYGCHINSEVVSALRDYEWWSPYAPLVWLYLMRTSRRWSLLP
jgi:hypothetical protein